MSCGHLHVSVDCVQSLQEYEYLDFVSQVTRDILSRGILSDSAMALLFKSHMERNKHKLKEVWHIKYSSLATCHVCTKSIIMCTHTHTHNRLQDVMLEKIESLKRELGISG